MAFSVSYVYEIIDRYSAPIRKIQERTARFAAVAEAASRKVGSIGRSLTAVGDKMSSVGQKMTTGITLVGAAIAGLALKAAADFEQFEVSFGVMLGDMKKGEALMRDLADFGKKTPFELTGITKASKKLLAFGVAGEDVVSRLGMLGDISSGVGAPLEDMAHIFGKVKAKGKAMTEEIMQFAERGVPILDVLADKMKHKFGGNMDKAKAAVFKLAEKGKIKFAEIKDALEAMTKEGGKFHNMMLLQSGTLGGVFSNLKDAIDMAFVSIGKTIVKVFNLKSVIANIGDKVNELTDRFSKWAEANPGLAKLALSIAGIIMVMGPLLLVLAPIIKLIGFLGIGIGAVTAPILLAIAGVVLLVMMFRRWASSNHPVIKSMQRLVDAVEPLSYIFGFLIEQLGNLGRWLFGSAEDAGALAHVFDVIGLALIPVIAGVTMLINLLTGESNDTVFAGMLSDLDEFRKGTSMVSQVYDGMITRVSAWIEGVMGFFTMIGTEIDLISAKIDSFGSGITNAAASMQADIAGAFSKINPANWFGEDTAKAAARSGENSGDNKSENAAKAQEINITGRIGVSASKGGKIEEAGIGLNQGANLATVM